MKLEEITQAGAETVEQALAQTTPLEGPVTRDVLRAFYAGRHHAAAMRDRLIGVLARMDREAREPMVSGYVAGYSTACADYSKLLKEALRT